MDSIREFTQDDVPAVADLFQSIFRRTKRRAPESLRSYLVDLYLKNPWHDWNVHSLVYVTNGSVAGFVGAMPFPFIVGGKRLRTVIAGNLMIDPDIHNPFAAVRMLRQLFAGAQDVTWTDTANHAARKILEGLGSVTIPTYSLQWLRILKPNQYAASLLAQRNRTLAPVSMVLRPLCLMADALLSRIGSTPFAVKKSEFAGEELDVETLLKAIGDFSRKVILAPEYDMSSLTWLLKKAEEKKEYGSLKKVAVFDKNHALVGWYMYYPNPNKAGQVLQWMATPNAASQVLSHMLGNAQEAGSLALIGRFEPMFMANLSEQNSLFFHRASFVQAYSRKPEFIDALYRGNAFFTRLEGEWWTRLQGDRFE
jgi:hypothetical protein